MLQAPWSVASQILLLFPAKTSSQILCIISDSASRRQIWTKNLAWTQLPLIDSRTHACIYIATICYNTTNAFPSRSFEYLQEFLLICLNIGEPHLISFADLIHCPLTHQPFDPGSTRLCYWVTMISWYTIFALYLENAWICGSNIMQTKQWELKCSNYERE